MRAIVVLLALAPIGARPVYAVREYVDAPIVGINPQTQRVSVALPKGGYQSLSVGAKTWIIRDDEEAQFADLRMGQRLHVWYIPRGGQAVVLEILRSEAPH